MEQLNTVKSKIRGLGSSVKTIHTTSSTTGWYWFDRTAEPDSPYYFKVSVTRKEGKRLWDQGESFTA